MNTEDKFLGITMGVWANVLASVVDAHMLCMNIGLNDKEYEKAMPKFLMKIRVLYSQIDMVDYIKFCYKALDIIDYIAPGKKTAIRCADMLGMIIDYWNKEVPVHNNFESSVRVIK